MKILQLISSRGYYGAEAMLVSLTKALRAGGEDATIGLLQTASPGSLDVAEVARRQSLPVELISCTGKWDRAAVREIRRIVHDGRIDVVHGHGYKSDLYGYLATRKTATKRVATCHDSGLTKEFRLSSAGVMEAYGWLDKLVLRRFDGVAAVSPQIANALLRAGVPSERLHVIDNGIDQQQFAGAAPAPDLVAFKAGAPLIGLVGRLTAGKGHDVLLHAARDLERTQSSPKFVFIGDGGLEQELRGLAAELGLTGNVLFAGKRADMPSVYAALDVFVLPSLNEGMPIAVLEAMAAATPVVASGVGAIPNLIANRRSGVLVAPGDVASLRDAIAELLSSRELRAQITASASQFVHEHYSAQAMAAKYVQMYAEILRDSAPCCGRW